MIKNKHLVYIPSTLKSVKEHMTPGEFLATEAVRKYIQKRMLQVTSNIPIKIIYDDLNYTDGREIHLDPYQAAQFTDSHFDALFLLLGIAFHETLHVVHTDFELCHKYNAVGSINGKKIMYSSGDYYLYRKILCDVVEDCAIKFWGKREYPGTLRKSLEYTDNFYYEKRPDLTDMAKHGARPIELLFSAFVVFGVMDIIPQFPSGFSEVENMFNECKPILTAARIAQKTPDRCKLANDIFEIIYPVITRCMDNGEKCPVFQPIQPSTHNRFDRTNSNVNTFRRTILDRYDIKPDLAPLMDAAAKNKYDRDIDDEYCSKLLKNISKFEQHGLGPMHNTIKIKYIPADVDLFASYKEAYQRRTIRLTSKVKFLLKDLLSVIQKEQDDTIGRLYAGNRYKEPHRVDKKSCSYKNALSDPADLFIYVLVDASGSMGFISEYVKDALTMFCEVCKTMDIPITIASHTANGNLITMKTLVDANMRSNENTGIEGFEVQGGTRDGVALACAVEYLKFRQETQKIIIAISDGEPWHTCDLKITPELMQMSKRAGLKSENEEDAKEFFREYSNYSATDIKFVIRSRGIYPIGIALAPTMDEANLLNSKLKKLYPESFATDIDHLAKKLSKVLEKYLYD